MTTILETTRLKLRELVPGDVDFMAEMLADAEVMRYYPKRLTRELSTDWIERQIARYKADGYGLWLAEERESGKPVGQVGLVRQQINGADECEGAKSRRRTWPRTTISPVSTLRSTSRQSQPRRAGPSRSTRTRLHRPSRMGLHFWRLEPGLMPWNW